MIPRTGSVHLSVTVGVEPAPAVSDYGDPTGFVADEIAWNIGLASETCYLDVLLRGSVPDRGEITSRLIERTSWAKGSPLPELDEDAEMPVQLVDFLRAIGAIT